MSGDRNVCGMCRDWNQGDFSPRHGYCRTHDRFKEYSDTCDRFRLSQWFADQAEIAALRERAEKAEAALAAARAEALREAAQIIRTRVQSRIETHIRAAASKIDAGIAGGMAALADDVSAAIRDMIMRAVPDIALIEKESPDAPR